MIVATYCDQCGLWFSLDGVEQCVDCHNAYCADCAALTNHRTVHEDAQPHEERPQGWTYLRCATTPYSVHDDPEAA